MASNLGSEGPRAYNWRKTGEKLSSQPVPSPSSGVQKYNHPTPSVWSQSFRAFWPSMSKLRSPSVKSRTPFVRQFLAKNRKDRNICENSRPKSAPVFRFPLGRIPPYLYGHDSFSGLFRPFLAFSGLFRPFGKLSVQLSQRILKGKSGVDEPLGIFTFHALNHGCFRSRRCISTLRRRTAG
jgi:hypothetical protein